MRKAPLLAKQTTTSTGEALTLIAAEAGFADFLGQMTVGDTCLYGLFDGNGTGWEFGIGTLTSLAPDIFTRATVTIFTSTGPYSPITLSTGTHTLKAVDITGFLNPDANGAIDCGAGYFRNLFPELIMAVTADTATTAVDLTGFDFQKINIVMDIVISTTLSFTNYPWTQSGWYAEFTIVIRQDATGGWVLTLPASFVPTALSPAISTAADSVNIIDAVSFDGGINWVYTVK